MADVLGRSINIGQDTLDNAKIDKILNVLTQVDNKMSRYTTDMTRSLDENSKSVTESVTGFSKAGEALGKTLQIVGSRLIEKFTSSYSRIQDAYLKNFSDITVRMQLSASEYTQIYKDAAASFREQGLATQFTSVDYINQLSENLSTGLRGQIAESKSMQDLIVKKLVPAINTNSKGYREMYKTFGDTFAQNTAAYAKYTERILGMEAYEEGEFNATLDQLAPFITYGASQYGLDPNKVLNRLTTIDAAMRSAGMDPSSLFGSILQTFTEGVNTNYLTSMSGLTTSEDFYRIFGSDEAFSEYSRKYGLDIQNLGRQGITAGVLQAKALGASPYDVTNSAKIPQYFDALTKMEEGNFNAEQEYQEYYGKLQENFYTNITEQANNWTDNQEAVVDTATFIAEKIPYGNELLKDIAGIASSILQAIIYSKAIDTAGDILGKGTKVGGKGLPAEGTGGVKPTSALTRLGGAATAVGGFEVAKFGFSNMATDFDKGYTGAGTANAIGGSLGAAGGVAGIATMLGAGGAIPVLGPILVGVGGALVAGTYVYDQFIREIDGAGNSIRAMSDQYENTIYELNRSHIDQLMAIKNLNTDTEKYNALLNLGVNPSILDTTDNFDLLIQSLIDSTNAIDTETRVRLGAENAKVAEEVSGKLDETYWMNFIGSVGALDYQSQYDILTTLGNAIISESERETWFKDFNKKSKQGFTPSELAYLTYWGPNKDKLSALAFDYNALNEVIQTYSLSRDLYLEEVDQVKENFEAAQAENEKEWNEILGTTEENGTPHATGIYNIGRDNYSARLHAGEMVLTKVNADEVRNFMEGKTSFKDAIYNIVSNVALKASNAGNSTLTTSTVISKLDDIGSLLTMILDNVINISSTVNSTNNQPLVSRNINLPLLNYKGGVSI